MFVLGAGGFVNELLREGQERPFVIAACMALMGLPFVLTGERQLRASQEEKEEKDK